MLGDAAAEVSKVRSGYPTFRSTRNLRDQADQKPPRQAVLAHHRLRQRGLYCDNFASISSTNPLWRNWLARLTVTTVASYQEVGSSSLPGGGLSFCPAGILLHPPCRRTIVSRLQRVNISR